MKKTNLNRRQAIIACAATLASQKLASAVPQEPTASKPSGNSAASTPTKQKSSVCVFTKPFNSLSFDELAERIAELGFDGLEAPIRKGGHMEPVEVADKLPQLVEALEKRDLELTIMTSDINDPADPLTAKTLKVAADLGIRRYRMSYLKYDLKRSVMEQLNEWRPRLRDLAAMNREIGIQALYQNHAGKNTFGAPLWDLNYALEGIAKNEIGVAYDIRHAVVEGGKSWPISYNLIQPHIDTVYVKDFIWEGKKTINVPLGAGVIPREFFTMLADARFAGPISLHEEYLDHRQPDLVPDHLAAIKKDLATLRRWRQH